MSCLNCNRETSGTDVFCDECKKVMEAYPVQKGTPVTIPVQPSPVVPKKQTTRLFASVDEQLAAAYRTNRRLAICLITLSLLLILAAAALSYISLFGMPAFLRA